MSTRLATLLVCGLALCWIAPGGATRQDRLHRALDRYGAGDHDAAIASVDRTTTASALRAAAEQWIQVGDAALVARRQRVAAAFTLEVARGVQPPPAIAHPAPPQGSNWHWMAWRPLSSRPWAAQLSDVKAIVPIVAWGCHLIDSASIRHPVDRHWDLVSVALLQQADASAALIDWRPASESPRMTDALLLRERAAGHLAHARVRTPDEWRWSMADAVARGHGENPPILEYRRGVLRYRPSSIARLPNIAARFAALTGDPLLSVEARLRLAHVELLRQRWTDALDQIDRARPALADPFLAAIADYFSGWALEQTGRGRHPDAIAAYRRALSFSPRDRSISTLLAAELFLGNDRVEAYAILDAAFKVEPEPTDLVIQLERGDGRFLAQHVARMREALR